MPHSLHAIARFSAMPVRSHDFESAFAAARHAAQSAAASASAAETLPEWNLTDLYAGMDAPELTALRAFGVRSLPDGVSFFFDGGPDELLPALYALHPQALTVEEAGADDLLALAQEGETP